MECYALNAYQRLVNVSSNCEKSNQRSAMLTVKCDCPTFHSDDDAFVEHGRLTKGLQNCFWTSWQRWKTTKFHPRVHSLWEMHLMTMREGSAIQLGRTNEMERIEVKGFDRWCASSVACHQLRESLLDNCEKIGKQNWRTDPLNTSSHDIRNCAIFIREYHY